MWMHYRVDVIYREDSVVHKCANMPTAFADRVADRPRLDCESAEDSANQA
jgi:hypothetical protein